MGKAGAARKLASAAAYGGTGLSLLGGSLYGLLRAEAKLARHSIGRLEKDPPEATGWYGRGRPGPAIKVALLGDSSSAGYGVASVQQTTGAVLASGVAEQAEPAGVPAQRGEGGRPDLRPRGPGLGAAA